ncbi:MAG: prephenate dehydrogenase [Deltaproteobacteria bacterium]|jgi:prephenate dehydrogenase|nr:MAG: prephenate dehydrogenase [Deltaproteobacteria bacterium]
MHFKKVAVVGIGLIGGSLAWALKKSGKVGEVFGVDVDKGALSYAVDKGIVDRGSNKIEEVRDSEVVVVATHVRFIPEIVSSLSCIGLKDTVVTDVGSVKESIVKEVERRLPPYVYFVGGHPIAGTENSGVWFSDFALFKNKRCVLTPTERTHARALEIVTAMWKIVGAEVFIMDPKTHDRVFGFLSHLPHVVAYALLNSTELDEDSRNFIGFAGGGLRDYTRIGASSPDMWSDIFLANKENVLLAIHRFKEALERIEVAIKKEDEKELKSELGKAVGVKRRIE